jgi:hypothetical protein
MDQQKPSLLPLVAQMVHEVNVSLNDKIKRKKRLAAKVKELSARVEDFQYTQKLLK